MLSEWRLDTIIISICLLLLLFFHLFYIFSYAYYNMKRKIILAKREFLSIQVLIAKHYNYKDINKHIKIY
jgi:hypothetical protein